MSEIHVWQEPIVENEGTLTINVTVENSKKK